MRQEISDANQQSDLASCQAALKTAVERATQFELWEKTALIKLSQANLKIYEHQAAHHQTHLRLIQSLNNFAAIQSDMQGFIQTRDNDVFWRLGKRLRNFISIFPKPVITYSRKILKLIYWAATPWKMKSRLQFIKNRNHVQAKLLDDIAENAGYTYESDQKINSTDITMNASATDLYRSIQKSIAES